MDAKKSVKEKDERKKKIIEKEILLKEAEFFKELGAKIQLLHSYLHVSYPIERVEKGEPMPIEVDLLSTQFKALSDNAIRMHSGFMMKAYGWK
jgi:hypothetical protein